MFETIISSDAHFEHRKSKDKTSNNWLFAQLYKFGLDLKQMLEETRVTELGIGAETDNT